MITALDTTVLLDILLPSVEFCDISARALEDSAIGGSLVICDIVYAELCAHFQTQRQCDEFLQDSDIRAEPLGRPASFLASRIWRAYRFARGKGQPEASNKRCFPRYLCWIRPAIRKELWRVVVN